jgi:hypothetical protein
VSSAILYVAIVAIWALVLVPRWLRRSHNNTAQVEAAFHSESSDGSDSESWAGADESEREEPSHVEGRYIDGRYVEVRYYERHEFIEQDTAEEYWARQRHDSEESSETEGGGRGLEGTRRATRRRGQAGLDPVAVARRASVLRARRRMLTTLVVLTLGAVGLAVTHFAAKWVVIPPTVMLAGFLVLLREARKSDAEQARKLAAHRSRQASVPAEASETVDASPEVAVAAEPDAEIIDISARVNDQLYDQYEDAAVRAVGD